MFNRYPSAVKFIFGNELCERFSYYGLRAVLAIYLHSYLGFTEDKATSIVHFFIFSAYATPLIGGWISDSYLGKYKTIIYLSLVYAAGCTVMSVTAIPGLTGNPPHPWGAYLGLFLIALGTGGIKPCVSSFGGDQFSLPTQAHLMSSFFSFFYFAINIGALISTFVNPILRTRVGFDLAFGLPAFLLCFATFVLWCGRSKYRIVPPTGGVLGSVLSVIWVAIRENAKSFFSCFKRGLVEHPHPLHWLDSAKKEHSDRLVEDVKAVFNALKIFIPMIVFWSLFDQQASRWVFQASRMNLNLVSDFNLQPDQMFAFNSLFMLTLVPIFDRWVYPTCARLKINTSPLRRMGFGMLFTSAAFAVSAVLEMQLDGGAALSVLWQIPQFFLIVISEVLVMITGLEFSYSQAPPTMKGVVSALWCLTTSLGNALVAIVADLSYFSNANGLFFFSILMLVFVFIFALIARNYNYNEFFDDVGSGDFSPSCEAPPSTPVLENSEKQVLIRQQ